MLKRFLYLDQQALGDYLSALEGGTRAALERRTVVGGSAEGGVDARVVTGSVGKKRENEESLSLSDTPQARFERLLQLVNADPEAAAWIEVMDPAKDLEDVAIGAMIDLECDVYVPDIVRAMSTSYPSGGISQALQQLDALLPFATALGLDTSGLPSKQERDAVAGFAQNLSSDIIAVGEPDSSDWHIAGQLTAEYINGDIEGVARVVGKVSAQWSSGQWKPLLALPGSSLLPRAQRRELERQRPSEGQDGNYLEGPALMLDILAIYR